MNEGTGESLRNDSALALPCGGLSRPQAWLKRGFDLGLALVLLLLLWPIILVTAFVAWLDTGESGFFVQTRSGRYGVPFRIVKIRTMRRCEGVMTTETTVKDPRITRLGRRLRQAKLDELPQLYNVLVGDMSFVGPRPDMPAVMDTLQGADRIVMSVRPGITGPASLKYRNEESLLAEVADPERFSREVLFPDKTRINCRYVIEWSMKKDIGYMWRTVFNH